MNILRKIFITLMVLAAWELLAWGGFLNPLLIGTPSMIVRAAMKDGVTLLVALRFTFMEILIAGMIAWISGVIAGVIIGARVRTAVIVSPLLSAMIAVPLVVLYPVIVAWTGIGPISKIIYGAATGFFPIALTTISGVSAIDQRYVDMARAMGANRFQIRFQVIARLALPAIMSGLRVGSSLVVIAVVQSEMLSATDGLGFWISYHRALFNVGQVYFGIGLVLVLAAGLNVLLNACENSLKIAHR
jgi:NitT/TauT family transport system permease protein/taurine transport system permease protein